MDPISTIVAALAAGAAEAAKPTAVQAVKDAYEGFKALIVRKENIEPKIFSSSAPGSEIICVVVSVKPKSTRMANTEA